MGILAQPLIQSLLGPLPAELGVERLALNTTDFMAVAFILTGLHRCMFEASSGFRFDIWKCVFFPLVELFEDRVEFVLIRFTIIQNRIGDGIKCAGDRMGVSGADPDNFTPKILDPKYRVTKDLQIMGCILIAM